MRSIPKMTKPPIRRMPHDEAKRWMLEGSAWIDHSIPDDLRGHLAPFDGLVSIDKLLSAVSKSVGQYRHSSEYVAVRATPSEQKALLSEMSELAVELHLRLRALPGSASAHLATSVMSGGDDWYASLQRLPEDLLKLQAAAAQAAQAAQQVPIAKKGRRSALVRDAFLSEIEFSVQASRVGSKKIAFSKAAEIVGVIARNLVQSQSGLDSPEVERVIRTYRKSTGKKGAA